MIALPPIEHDELSDRTYIPVPGGYEFQTKGRGSTYRIAQRHDGGDRWAVLDPFMQERMTAMAMAIRADYEALLAENGRLKVENEGLRGVVHDEIAANAKFREAGGALPEEDMPTFCARLLRERDSLRLDAERYRWLRSNAKAGALTDDREFDLLAESEDEAWDAAIDVARKERSNA